MDSKSFRKEWKKLETKITGLTRHPPDPEALEKSLGKIKAHLDACIKAAKNVDSRLKNFRDEVQGDLDNARTLVKHVEHLQKLEKEFRSQSEGFRELEAKTSEVCGKYFDRQQEYMRASRKAEERVDQGLSNIRAKFLEKAESIARGYEVKVDSEECSPEELYEGLKKQKLGRIYLAPKSRGKAFLGLLGEKENKSKAKEEVLRYLMGETARKIAPMLRDKQEHIDGVNHAFLDLKTLEVACKEAEKLRVKAEKPIEELRVKILGIRMSKAFAYSKKEKLQKLKKGYLSRIGEIEGG